MNGDDDQPENGADPPPADKPYRSKAIYFIALALLVAVLEIFAYASR